MHRGHAFTLVPVMVGVLDADRYANMNDISQFSCLVLTVYVPARALPKARQRMELCLPSTWTTRPTCLSFRLTFVTGVNALTTFSTIPPRWVAWWGRQMMYLLINNNLRVKCKMCADACDC